MSFDKAKTMRSAERYLAQGKLHSAISEYEQVIEQDPKDFNTLNMLGDLHINNSAQDKATECYRQVAEHYEKQGFVKKAIAIFNKVLRIQPDSVEVLSNLAQLYHAQGSVAETRDYYKKLAAIYENKGQKAETVAIWKKIAEMDSNDFDIYLRIAESHLQENQFEEAAKAYNQSAARAVRLDNYEAAAAAFSKTLEINPDDTTALDGFIRTQIALENSDEAAKKLEESLEKHPNNKEIIYLLTDCYIEMNNPQKAEKIIVKLLEQEPASYVKLLELIGIYLRSADADSATRILSITTEKLLASGQDEEFTKHLDAIFSVNSEQLDAIKLLIRYQNWKRDPAELREALVRLAEAARNQDAPEEEKFALVQLVMIEPQNDTFAEHLQEVKISTGDYSETVSQIEVFSAESETPVFEHFSDNGGDQTESSEIISFEDFETFYGGEETDFTNYDKEKTSSNNGYQAEAVIVEDTEFDEHIYENDDSEPAQLSPANEVRLEQEIEGIEFYISQKYQDLADKALCLLEDEFGNRPEIVKLRRRIDSFLSGEIEENKDVSEVAEVSEENFHSTEENIITPAIIENFIAEEAEETDFSTSLSNFDDFKSELGFEQTQIENISDQYETHFHLATAYQEMGLMEDAIREFQDAINLVKLDDGTRRFFKCANLLGHCFTESGMPNLALIWYQRALENNFLDDREKQALYYEIGKVYEIGGEDEKALEYFEQIYALDVDYRDTAEHLENLRQKIEVAA